jgi:hypothetical protein
LLCQARAASAAAQHRSILIEDDSENGRMSQSTEHTLATLYRSSDPAPQCLGTAHSGNRYSRILLLLFILTLPLINPWVRGDGVGYYAHTRSLLVEHKLDFANDWRAANESFTMGRVRPDGTINPREYTRTGHLDNHFAVGPSMLWAPFLVPVHCGMLALQKFGINVQANGYSRPYLVTMALATALYGFLGLLISFRLACLYTDSRSAFLATLGIWFASSIPVYMYFNPSWSHAHSVFVVALFLWYWHRTRQRRTLAQWVILGLLSGLMIDVYYLNIAVLLIPFLESLRQYVEKLRCPERDWAAMGQLFKANIAYCFMLVVAFLPTLITRKIIYGSPFDLGYAKEWSLQPALLQVLFSSDHGLLTWTPILILAILGLLLLRKHDKELAGYLFISFLAFYGLVSLHTNWDGLSSFGNRFFISLTPIFVLGLAVSLSEFAKWLGRERNAMAFASLVIAFLIVWNMAFMFQWGTHMVPVRGPISWKQMACNQFLAVPQRAATEFAAYFENRRALMHKIEQDDIWQLKQQQGATTTK